MNENALGRIVIGIIADTFNADPLAITRSTTAEDVDGWDSLGHSVLMTRLSRKLGLEIGEDIASGADTVGELIDMLEHLKRRSDHAAA